MLKLRWLLCVAMGLVLIVGTAARAEGKDAEGQKPAKKKKAPRKKAPKKAQALRGYYAIMSKQLKLTEDQQAKLTEAIKAVPAELKTATADWKKKSTEAKAALAAARKAKDADAIKAAQAKSKQVNAAKPTNASVTAAKLDGILTDEQKSDWAGYKMYTRACNKYRKCKLTDEQKTKVRETCNPLAAKLATAEDKKAQAAVAKELDDAVAALLTDEQKKAIAPKAKMTKDARAAKAKAAKEAKAKKTEE